MLNRQSFDMINNLFLAFKALVLVMHPIAMSFMRLLEWPNGPHGASTVNLYLPVSLLHLLFWFRGCQLGPGMNGCFPLISVTPIISQLLFLPRERAFKLSCSGTYIYRSVQEQHYFVILWLTRCIRELSNCISLERYFLLDKFCFLWSNIYVVEFVALFFFFHKRDRRLLWSHLRLHMGLPLPASLRIKLPPPPSTAPCHS